ncbi:hypothetical protein SERLADRAFT_379446, partial [Serpula lacrymans var. lacrymans S7.9]
EKLEKIGAYQLKSSLNRVSRSVKDASHEVNSRIEVLPTLRQHPINSYARSSEIDRLRIVAKEHTEEARIESNRIGLLGQFGKKDV